MAPRFVGLCTGLAEGRSHPTFAGMKKILITGASGFIGGHLVREALEGGYEVWAGVRRSSSLGRLPKDRVHLIDLSYADPEALAAQVRAHAAEHGRWDGVVHNAGVTKTVRPADFFEVNTEYTRRLLAALNAGGEATRPDRFVLMSSLSAFGRGDERTFRPISADDEPRPESIYGRSKLAAEQCVREQTTIPYTILRPTGVYGPGDRDYGMEIESIRAGFDFKIGRTPQRLTFIYAKDLARVVRLALERPEAVGRSYFVADGDVYTDDEFAGLIQELLHRRHVLHARIPLWLARVVCTVSEAIGRMTGRPATLNTDKYHILKQRNWICDVSPLRHELGFTPEYDLRRGLEEIIAETNH